MLLFWKLDDWSPWLRLVLWLVRGKIVDGYLAGIGNVAAKPGIPCADRLDVLLEKVMFFQSGCAAYYLLFFTVHLDKLRAEKLAFARYICAVLPTFLSHYPTI